MTRGPRGTLVVVLLAVLVVAWGGMEQAARGAMFFEPTTEALARAARARPAGIGWAVVLVVAAALLAVVGRRAGLVLLAVPGVVTGAALALAPQMAAFVLGLGATAVTVPLVLVVVALGGRRRSPPGPSGRSGLSRSGR